MTVEHLYLYLIFILFTVASTFEMTKFSANLAFLFTESTFLERYQLAKNAGFKCVETGFPFGLTKEEVLKAKDEAKVEQVLINIYTGDVSKGELGFAAIPGKEMEFKDSIRKTLEYAKALGVPKIHIMSGKIIGEVNEENDQTYEKNLKYAVDLLKEHNITALIEPINPYSIPGYYMNSYERALEVVKKINSPNLKILLDIFHLQHIRGDITNTIKKLNKFIGHVQIAQVPNRNEPNCKGELNYSYILTTLKKEGYTDWIGLEYKPEKQTVSGLKWINEMGFQL